MNRDSHQPLDRMGLLDDILKGLEAPEVVDTPERRQQKGMRACGPSTWWQTQGGTGVCMKTAVH